MVLKALMFRHRLSLAYIPLVESFAGRPEGATNVRLPVPARDSSRRAPASPARENSGR